jgi:tRNA (guanine-N7-)-methyltransferase
MIEVNSPIKFNLTFNNNLYIDATQIKPQIVPFASYYPIEGYDIFGNSQPLNIEIGSGNGAFIEYMAYLNKNENFLGFEIVKKVLMKAVNRIYKRSLTNVRLIHYDALFFIKLLKNNSIKNIYINFPDPWPKRKHNKRRLIKHDFLSLIYNKLEHNGLLYIVTDHEDYALDIKNTLLKSPFSSVYNDLYVNFLDNYFETKYYKKFAKNNRVFFFKLIKVDKK